MKLNPEVEEFRREELPGRYTAKLLYGWDDKKFDEEYLKKIGEELEQVEEQQKGRFEEEIQRIRMKKGKEIKLN